MANLSLKHIYKVYPNGTKAVNDFTMDIKDKEFIVFVGPSGCGKSTTLRMIAGLEEISAGELKIGDVVVNDAEPKERDIAMVFQNYALYPHMTIFDNIAFGLKMRKVPKDVIKQKVEEAANTLGITEYLNKKPKEMSGGQRQRVALGRAIVREPKVMLLDEPLSNLDAKLRTQMRSEIVKLHDKLKTTFIYVTHDQVEAMTMGTRIVVMKDGFIKQIDTPKNLYLYPDNKFVAGFIGTPQMNFINGVLSRKDKAVFVTLTCNNEVLTLPLKIVGKMTPKYLHQESSKVTIGIRPEDVTFEKEEGHNYAEISLLISHNEELGTETLVYTNIYANGKEEANMPRLIVKSKAFNSIATNTVKTAYIDLDKMHIFDDETEENIIPRLPKYVYLNGAIKDENLSILGKKCAKPTSINLKDGKCQLILPLDGVINGARYKGKINRVEEINGRYLYSVTAKDEHLFILRDDLIEGEDISFDLDFKTCDFKYEDELVTHLNLNNELVATFNLDKKKAIITENDKKRKVNQYYYKMINNKFMADENMSRKMFNAYTNRKVFNTMFTAIVSPYDVHISNEGTLQGSIKEVFTIGEEKFAVIDYNNQLIYSSLNEDMVSGASINFDIDIKNMSVIETERNIRII